jgi:hypothetical protein
VEPAASDREGRIDGAPLEPYTVADLRRLREETKDRLEMIEGEVFRRTEIQRSAPGASVRLTHALFVQVELAGTGRVLCGPIDVKLSDVDVVQPDLVVILPTAARASPPRRSSVCRLSWSNSSRRRAESRIARSSAASTPRRPSPNTGWLTSHPASSRS